MNYFNYNDLLQPSDETDLDNFRESLNKEHGFHFNKLINIFNLENIEYTVIEGFNYNSEDNLICNFKKITFSLTDNTDIDSILKKYELDGLFTLIIKDNMYIFIIKE